MKFYIENKDYSLFDIYNCCYKNSNIELSDTVKSKIINSRKLVDELAQSSKTIYGINTGFGKLSQIKIDNKDINKLQENLLMSHSAGVGDPCPKIIVKIMILLKIVSFAKGYSGIRIEVVDFLIQLFNNNCLPVVPLKGSVGASGDLAPLSHLFSILIGKGKVNFQNKIINAKQALKKNGLKPIKLEYKEGLALINGTQFSTAYGVSCLFELNQLMKIADISGAMSVEGLMCSKKPFQHNVHDIKPFKGQLDVSMNLMNLLEESEIMDSHKDCDRVQDIYSIRCMPQVHGPSRDLIHFANKQINIEINSVSDNPLVFVNDHDIISAGHFHAEAVGHSLDVSSLAVASLSNISERRIFSLLLGEYGLPKFLIESPGLNSGFMMLQVTAAALASENKLLANPSSADSITTCSNQEDYVSMAPYSGRKLKEGINNFKNILAIELLCASQAIDFRGGLKPAKKINIIHKLIRSNISFLTKDRYLDRDLKSMNTMIENGSILDSLNKKMEIL